jgi:hypothetical protein
MGFKISTKTKCIELDSIRLFRRRDDISQWKLFGVLRQ